MPISNIILKNLTPRMRYGSTAPLGYTSEAGRFGFRPPPPEPPPTGVIMSLDFNSAPDWHSEMYADALDVERLANQGNVLPVGAYAAYMNHQWTPAKGYPTSPVGAAILSANADKAFGGVGKSYVVQRQSNTYTTSDAWNSDDQLIFTLHQGVSRVYVEFMIKFDTEWTVVGASPSKLVRAGHWNGVDSKIFSGSNGGLGPLVFIDYSVSGGNAINIIAFRGGPPGTNYLPTADDIGAPIGYWGDISLNYTSSINGQAVGGGNPQLIDKQNGGFLPSSGAATHSQVFGPPASGQWTKFAFMMELNSAPDVKDGKYYQWVDNKRIYHLDNVCWYKNPPSGPAYKPLINYFSIGGNDFFHTYPDEDRHSEWLSYDNVIVRHDPPPEAEQ